MAGARTPATTPRRVGEDGVIGNNQVGAHPQRELAQPFCRMLAYLSRSVRPFTSIGQPNDNTKRSARQLLTLCCLEMLRCQAPTRRRSTIDKPLAVCANRFTDPITVARATQDCACVETCGCSTLNSSARGASSPRKGPCPPT